MSDEELARLMGGGKAPSQSKVSPEDLEPGARLRGRVLEVTSAEVMLELDGKTMGLIERVEFPEGELPVPGAFIEAELVRYDSLREVCILTVGAVRSEAVWEEMRVGQRVEGLVTEVVKGGLVLDLKGTRAFLPISQIALIRVEDLTPYLGQRLGCEIQEIDRATRNVVVSRRVLLEEERAGERKKTLAALKPGDVRRGTVARVTEHGAFVNLGGVDGLLHTSRLQRRSAGDAGGTGLKVGQVVEVEVMSVDAARGRISLDFHHVAHDSWDTVIGGFKVGDEVTGWIQRIKPDGAFLSLAEGLEAFIPLDPGAPPPADLRPGVIVKAAITSIDASSHRIMVKPRSG
jgi:small subunit ribosomal protein S1